MQNSKTLKTVLTDSNNKNKVVCLLTSPKGFSASKCDVTNWMFSKSYEFFEKLFGNVWIFLDFF